jgi:hypothetical protein
MPRRSWSAAATSWFSAAGQAPSSSSAAALQGEGDTAGSEAALRAALAAAADPAQQVQVAGALVRLLLAAGRLDDAFAAVLQQATEQPAAPEVDEPVARLWLALYAATVAGGDEPLQSQVGAERLPGGLGVGWGVGRGVGCVVGGRGGGGGGAAGLLLSRARQASDAQLCSCSGCGTRAEGRLAAGSYHAGGSRAGWQLGAWPRLGRWWGRGVGLEAGCGAPRRGRAPWCWSIMLRV